MRIVTVRHRDSRGKTDYTIYETREQLLKDKPDAIIKEKLIDAEVGDYVVAENGWVAPLIAIAFMKDKKIRTLRGVGYWRKEPIYHKIFHFPKDRKVFRLEKLGEAIFNYTPNTLNAIASEEKRNRFHELSARKMQWAQLVANGYDTFEATRTAFPRVRDVHKITKLMLTNEAVQKYVDELTPKPEKRKTLRDIFEEKGLNAELLARKTKEILDDPKSPMTLRKWATDTILKMNRPSA